MASRDLDDLYPPLRKEVVKSLKLAKSRGLKILVTNTWRAQGEQIALWMQGRKSLDEVNRQRRLHSLPKITEEENSRVVTWTKTSYHSTWTKSMAFDFCVIKDRKATWSIKVDVNDNDIPDYDEFGELCKEVSPNLEYGGDFSKKDRSHVQWRNGLKIDQSKRPKEKQMSVMGNAMIKKKKESRLEKWKKWLPGFVCSKS